MARFASVAGYAVVLAGMSLKERISRKPTENSRPRQPHKVFGSLWSGKTRVVSEATVGAVQAHLTLKDVKEIQVSVGILEL